MTSVALHPHEVARLQAEGSVMLVRPVEFDDNLDPPSAILLKSGDRFFVRYKDRPGEGVFVSCPWGTGDKLQVLEDWGYRYAVSNLEDYNMPPIEVYFRASLGTSDAPVRNVAPVPDGVQPYKWHPASTMPHWASRYTVEVLGVRAEWERSSQPVWVMEVRLCTAKGGRK